MITLKTKKEDIKGFIALSKMYGKMVAKKVDRLVQDNALLVETEAKLNAPKGLDSILRGSIKTQKDQEMKRIVVADTHYAPYVEFGTKTKVDIPAGLEEYAKQFKGGESKGGFKEAEDSIKRWGRFKGVPEENLDFLVLNIMKNGIKAQPFLFPAFNRLYPQLIKELKKELGAKNG